MIKINEYLNENGIKLSTSAKAAKLIKEGKSEAEIAIAMQSTKAYKEDAQLRAICTQIVDNAANQQVQESKKEDIKTSTGKAAEPRRRW